MARHPVTEIVLAYPRMPGDSAVLTSVLRDLARHHGNKIRIDVRTPHKELFENNPYLSPLKSKGIKVVTPSVHQWIKSGGEPGKLHFLTAMHKAVELKTGLTCPVYEPRPDFHLTEKERIPTLPQPYWVLVAGGKDNLTTKHWAWSSYQEVASGLRRMGLGVVQLGRKARGHLHAPLRDTIDLVGQTSLRQMLCIIAGAEGVICPITAAMHMAAGLEKPCVVIAGGREEPWWEWYGGNWSNFGKEALPVNVPHRFLHTLGKLPCCETRGCWQKMVVGNRVQGERICKLPIFTEPNQPLAKCMTMITPDEVLNAVKSYGQPMTGHSAPEPEPLIRLGAPQVTIERPKRILPEVPDVPLLDHPILGGKITIGTVLYGNYTGLHVRLLESLISTVPKHRLEIRIGLNEVSSETRDYLDEVFFGSGWPGSTITYVHETNDMKYPVMRQMLQDPNRPIDSKYLVWFDDDSYVVNPNWLSVLAETIIQSHPQGYRLYGIKFLHTLKNEKEAGWFKAADWYRGKPLQNNKGVETPNGDKIHFVSGGFWACETDTLRQASIPDVRLGMHGGDITIGEQIHQSGGKIKDFNRNKVHVHSSGSPPRGLSAEPGKKPLLWRN